MIQAEVDKRLAARLREIEEKTLPAALAKIQGLEMLKDRDVGLMRRWNWITLGTEI